MTTEERRRKAMLMAKEYPVKIKTSGGKYLIRVSTFQKDQWDMPINWVRHERAIKAKTPRFIRSRG